VASSPKKPVLSQTFQNGSSHAQSKNFMFTNTNVLNQFNALKTMKLLNDAEIVKSPNLLQLAEIASGGSGS